MSKIYANQTDLTLRLETGKDITGALSVKMCYKNPLGVSGEWIAEIEGTTIVKYNIIAPLGIVGKWTRWAKVVDAQGKISVGEPSNFDVSKEGY
jgi:hypothetical protein